MALERDLEKKCRTYAEAQGGRLLKIRTPGTRGFHDRLLILPRFAAFLEFKHPKGTGRKSAMQLHWQTYLTAMGIPAWEVASYTQFCAICRKRG
jgi:hypothetical protein